MGDGVRIVNGKINFECKMESCKNCCCGVFKGITNRLSNVDHRPFDEIVLTEEDYENLYRCGRSDLIEEGYSEQMGKKYFRMALEEDGSCKALVDGKCSINQYKPTLCRAFPFYFDMFSGLCAVNCEGFSDEHMTDLKDSLPSFEAARKMYTFWIDFYSDI